jgi:cysteinyl-tRNA synthetase, unknown class
MIVRQFLQWVRSTSAVERADAAAALARAYLYSALGPDDRAAAEGGLIMLLDDSSPLVRIALAFSEKAPPRRRPLPARVRRVQRIQQILSVSALLVLLVAALACASPSRAQTLQTREQAARVLAAAKSWGYQLQSIDPDQLVALPYDMLVIDYSRDGKQANALTPDDLARLKVKPDGKRRIVLSYLSIGEAEAYRYYWKWYWGWFFGLFAPEWRGPQNREWRGNYGVRYWLDDWQNIIFKGENSYVARILKAGFDGVYLDKVDEYVDMAGRHPAARADMSAFVIALAARARELNPACLVLPQNGEGLLSDAEYRAAIDGIGKEDLLYGEVKNQRPNNPEIIDANLKLLRLLRADGKPVFVVEYLDNAKEIQRARQLLLANGFVPYFADRGLDNMRSPQ